MVMRAIATLVFLACAAGAQAPRVGDIDIYGLRKLTQAEILQTAGVQSGGSLPASKGDLEEKLEQLRGVVEARVTAVCCQGDHTALFIGIEEQGETHAAFRSEPSGEAVLPQDLLDRYLQFLGAVDRAAAHGNIAEDFSAGHSMMDDGAARAIQPVFVQFANAHLEVLRKALHEASDPETRAAAAAIIGYGPKSQAVINELQFALEDPEPAVRANALHALSALIVYARQHPDAALKIEPVWLVELLHSVELRDREESSKALVLLTDNGGAQPALDLMRERSLAALAEMARWPTLRYALPPFLLMGRIAGLPDSETQQAFANNQREAVVQKALDTADAKARRSRK